MKPSLIIIGFLAILSLGIGLVLAQNITNTFESRCKDAGGHVEYLGRQQYLCLSPNNVLLFTN